MQEEVVLEVGDKVVGKVMEESVIDEGENKQSKLKK